MNMTSRMFFCLSHWIKFKPKRRSYTDPILQFVHRNIAQVIFQGDRPKIPMMKIAGLEKDWTRQKDVPMPNKPTGSIIQ